MHIHKLGFIGIAIFSTVAACSSSSSTKPSASGVFPSEGFTGRTLRVEISGDATTWKDGTTVDFGAGVTVNSVTVASPTDLFAEIAIDPAAAPGLHDVTVTGGGTFTLMQAFELKSPVDVAFVGDLDQGGFPGFTVTSHDFDNPFDGTTDPMTGAFTNLTMTGPAGTNFIIGNVSSYEITGFMSIDTDATAGAVTIVSGPSSAQITSVTGSAAIMPRTATALTGGTASTAMIPTENDSALFSLTATGQPSLVHIAMTSTDPNAFPVSTILPSSGHWADAIGNAWAVAPQGGQVFIVVFDGGTESGYSFQITANGEMLISMPEGNDTTNGTVAGALAATALPFEQDSSHITSATDIDYVKFTSTAGKRLHVVTTAGGDPATDTTVDVLGGAGGNTSYTPDGGPEDQTQCSFFGCTSFGEDFVTNPLPAGTVYVKVGAGPNFDPAHTPYTLIFWYE
jgi:hypothetical protein